MEVRFAYECVDGSVICYSVADWSSDMDIPNATSGYTLTLCESAIG